MIGTSVMKEFTHELFTLIGIIGTNSTSNISSSGVIPLSIGDHDIVGYLRKMNWKRFFPRTFFWRDYSNYDPESLCINNKNSNINLTDQSEMKLTLGSLLRNAIRYF